MSPGLLHCKIPTYVCTVQLRSRYLVQILPLQQRLRKMLQIAGLYAPFWKYKQQHNRVVPALWTFVQSEKISLPPRNGLPELTDFSTAIPLLRATVRDRTVYWVSGTSMKGVYPLITIIQKPGHMHS
ncbi:uncharacterized protein M6G45_006154 isoform 2-T5 [Spheniscus humboldti]